jgi:hypothetical protein
MNRIMTGIDILGEGFDVEDTMLMAYELGVIPQGLKALAVRECAMPMMGYQEVLGDAQERHTLRYLNELWGRENARYQRMRDEDFRFQKDILKRRIKVRPKLPKLPLMSAAERVLGSKDPYKLWNNQNDDVLAGAYKVMRSEVPEASLSDVDPEVAIRYAGRDPDATLRVAHQLLPRVRAMGLEPVYRLDLSTLPIIARMMDVGIKPDPEAFAKLSTLLDKELLVLQRKLADVTTWGDFNPNSGDQVAEYLYGVLGVEQQGKQTDSGRGSTNDKVLEALQRMYPEYPQIADIRSYREYHKLRWTFVERLPELVERWPFDQRIHCELMLNRTPSGRLAAKAPNLLAMPRMLRAARRLHVPVAGRIPSRAEGRGAPLPGPGDARYLPGRAPQPRWQRHRHAHQHVRAHLRPAREEQRRAHRSEGHQLRLLDGPDPHRARAGAAQGGARRGRGRRAAHD